MRSFFGRSLTYYKNLYFGQPNKITEYIYANVYLIFKKTNSIYDWWLLMADHRNNKIEWKYLYNHGRGIIQLTWISTKITIGIGTDFLVKCTTFQVHESGKGERIKQKSDWGGSGTMFPYGTTTNTQNYSVIFSSLFG